jgi:copper(I)-binding protein
VGQLVVSEFRVLAPPGGRYAVGGVASADLTIVNKGQQRDALISASSPVATSVHLLKFGERQAQAVIDGGGQLTEGVLLQLAGLRRAIAPGNSVSITLTFRSAGSLTLKVPVQKPATSPSASSG